MSSFSARQGVGLQMFTLRNLTKNDWEKTVRQVAKLGYKAIQISAMGHVPAEDLRKLMDELKLAAVGEHVGLGQLQDDLGGVIKRAQTLQCRWAFLPYLPETLQTPDGFRLIAGLLNQLAYHLKPLGLTTGYHNHAFEFEKLNDGSRGFDLLLSRCMLDVAIELDVYWAKRGGEDPGSFMTSRLFGRLPVLHVKDMAAGSEQKFAEIGQGILDWPSIFSAADTVGTEWMVVEQDNTYERDPMESVAISLEYMRKNGFKN